MELVALHKGTASFRIIPSWWDYPWSLDYNREEIPPVNRHNTVEYRIFPAMIKMRLARKLESKDHEETLGFN